jgi:hypothetical protein
MSGRRTFRNFTRSLLAVLIGAGVLLAAAAATSPPASAAPHATAGDTVVYSAQIDIPAPPASNFSGSAGGDGWGLAFTPTAVYNVFHHSNLLVVACHKQSDATPCWNPETITDGSGNNFSASGMPGVWMDQPSGHLFVYATRASDNTAGVVCFDTTIAATNPNPFCGFTALTAVGDAPMNPSGWSAITDPVVVGTSWYAFNYVAGTPSGSKDQLMCFSLVTFTPCAGQPYAVNLGDTPSVLSTSPSPGIAAFGTLVVIPVGLSSTKVLACVDTTTNANCSGTWPVNSTTADYPSGTNGSPYPMLSGTGAATGFCLPTGVDQCFGLDGSTRATPPGMGAVIGGNNPWDGPAVTIGARAYVIDGNTDNVQCWDYVSGASCTNFPKQLIGSSYTYSINTDPQRPTCLWTNANGGAAQIQNFDAYTAGACGQGPVRVLAASLVAPNNECIPSNYTSIQVLVPTRSQYSSGSVQFEDFNGNPIPSIPNQLLDATGSVNLAPLNLTTASPLPQFLITLNGAGSPPEVDVKLTWTGIYSPACTTGKQQVSGAAPGQGYRLGARDGGVFDFGQSAFFGAMTGRHLNGPMVGLVSTVDDAGYWQVASDGGVFAFGDATYHGGLGASVHLAAPIVGIAATSTGNGYWLVGADGGVFAYGDAVYQGSVAKGAATAPIVGIAATPTAKGYWLVSSDGNVYPFGDAVSHGTMKGTVLTGPIVGISASTDGGGYTLVGADGGVFAFGDAPFLGSMSGRHMDGPAVGIQVTPSGAGYWLDATDGGVFAFGDAQFLGCMVGSPLNALVDGITS